MINATPKHFIAVMGIHRPDTSSMCIEEKAYTPVGSNPYDDQFILATSSAALRLATPVKAAPEMMILTAKAP